MRRVFREINFLPFVLLFVLENEEPFPRYHVVYTSHAFVWPPLKTPLDQPPLSHPLHTPDWTVSRLSSLSIREFHGSWRWFGTNLNQLLNKTKRSRWSIIGHKLIFVHQKSSSRFVVVSLRLVFTLDQLFSTKLRESLRWVQEIKQYRIQPFLVYVLETLPCLSHYRRYIKCSWHFSHTEKI